jgi:hypothetical protein
MMVFDMRTLERIDCHDDEYVRLTMTQPQSEPRACPVCDCVFIRDDHPTCACCALVDDDCSEV